MNVKKSAAYCKLIENIKNKYRKNPIYTKNLTLGWCDLRQGEDLCQEINLWTYWQGRDYAKKTPHIKYMLIGQDFGPPEKEEIKGTIEAPKLGGLYHWHKSGVHYVITLYKADKFSGEMKSSEEGRVYWIPLEELKTKELATGMEHVLQILESEQVDECYMHLESDGYVGDLY